MHRRLLHTSPWCFTRASFDCPTAPGRWQREFALVGGLGLAFLALLAGVPHSPPSSFDRALAADIQAIPWGAFVFIPRLGSDFGGGLYGFYVLPAMAAVGFAATRQWRLLALLGAIVVLHYVLITPKLLVTAPRPSPIFGVDGGGGFESFPSGHVEWAVSFYGFLAYIGCRTVPGRLRWTIIPACALIVLATMLGRIELGRHWPLDTVAGMLAGLIALRLVVLLHALRAT